MSGLPPGISFTPSSRRASGTLPTVATETTYTVTYSVRDGAGASASVSFRATVVPPPAPPPPPPPSLSLPTIPDFRVPSGGSVDTVFPAATGGRRPYSYSVSGLPPGISFSHSTRRARGTLPTVLVDTTYTVTYSVRDSRSATDSVTFTVVVVAPAAPPPPPPLSLPAIPDSRLPSGGSVNTTLPAATGGVPPYRYSVSGLPPGITFDASTRSVSGTLPTVTADTTYRIVYTARDSSGTIVFGSVGTTVRFTTTVTASAAPPSDPPPSNPTPSPPTTDGGPIVKTGVNVSSSRTYPFTLSHRADVSVELTGMTTDFDCTLSGNRCTNRGGTRDDSWTGTLEAGEHKIVVYPYGGGSGNYTLTISAGAPTTGGSTGTRTQVTTLVDASETNISTSRTYSFTVARRAAVDVALTGLTIDFDCRVGSSRCTNRWGTRDDSWSGDLDQGSHSVVVYPYDPGPGNYSLTVTATETITFVATPLAGGPIRLRVCEKDSGGTDTDIVLPGSCVEVVIPGGEGDPDDDGDDDGTPPGGGGPVTPTQTGVNPATLTNRIRDCGWNFNEGDLFGAPRSGGRTHTGIDVQTHSDAEFSAFRGGVVELPPEQPQSCGWYVRIRHDDGGYEVHCHLDRASRPAAGARVEAGDHIGSWGGSGVHGGPHHHFKLVGPDGRARDPLEDRSAAEAAGFTFRTGPEQCEAPE